MVIKIDAQQFDIKNLTVKDGLPSNIIYDIKQDEIGYLWIATEKGLVKFDGDDFIVIHQQKSTALFIDGQTIYASLKNGLFVKNKSKEQFFNSKKILSFIKNDNEVLMGTIEGLYSFKNAKLLPIKINTALDSSSINDIVSIEKGFLISSSNGLHKVNKKLKSSILLKIKEDFFLTIEKYYNGYLTTTRDGEILHIHNDSITKITETFNDITSIKKIKNEVWITSRTNGIEVFTLPSFSFKQKINKYNSLQTNTVYNVFKDNYSNIYIASKKGIYVLSKPNFQRLPATKPILYFENLQVNHQNVDTLISAKNFKLSNLENNISISFKTVYIPNPKKVLYRYQLNGDFSPWSPNNTVQFSNLNTGRYLFKVQSKIGNLESNIKLLSFNIDSPFYLKAWFIFSIIITLLSIGYLSLDYHIKRINKKNNQKINELKTQNRLLSLEQKALQLQMNPHFIFNVLNGIKALGNNGNKIELNNTISKFSILLRGILNNSRKEEITLQDEIILLKNYIELEQRMSSKSFTYSINTDLNDIDVEEILIPTMLIQPFVENCIQHAFKKNSFGKININFEVKYGFLHCSIIDNGIGIHQSQKRKSSTTYKSVALSVSKERIFTISKNSFFKINEIIEENEIKGTKVNFRIPLKTDY